MEKLTKKEYWDRQYEYIDSSGANGRDGGKKTSIVKGIIKKLLGSRSDYLSNYAAYLLWDVIYKKYIPRQNGLKVLEVGSAPGMHLIKLNKLFGLNPFGVEYSDSGVEINKRNFVANNLDPDNVIKGDFFSDAFQNKYKNYFDIVVSRGFVEHFSNVDEVIGKHLDVLAEGGSLIVSVPNKTGIYYPLTWLLNRRSLSLHNLEIMKKKKFLEAFNPARVEQIFCDYFGTFLFNQLGVRPNSPKHIILVFLWKVQLILNFIFRVLFKDKGFESAYFSPYLLFIGKKLG